MAFQLPTEKTAPNLDPSKLRWLFYSEPKTGKTSLAAGFLDPLFLVTEKSTESITAYSADLKSWKDFEEAVTELLKGKHIYRTVVVDVVDQLYNYCVEHCCNQLGIKHQSDVGFAKAYHLIDNTFTHWINKLEMSGLGLVFTSHMSEKEVKTKDSSFIKIVPGLQPRGRTVLESKVSAIGCLKWERLRKPNSTKMEFENKLVIDFKQTSELLVGDRTGRMPDKLMLHTIPEGTIKNATLVEEYAKKNYDLICSYFK